MNHMRLSLYRNPARRAVEFYLTNRIEHEIYLAQPCVMEKVSEAAYVEKPTFSMTEEDAQTFIDALYREGFRPSINEAESTFAAQGRHLEDMRKIAFMFLEKHE